MCWALVKINIGKSGLGVVFFFFFLLPPFLGNSATVKQPKKEERVTSPQSLG